MFNLNISKIIIWCIPVHLRKPKTYAFISALCSPLATIYNEFSEKRTSVLEGLKYDGRVFKLEQLLNSNFDSEENRIQIVDGTTKDRIFVYTKIENKPVLIEGETVYTEIEYNDSGEDFLVKAPAVITTDAVIVAQVKAAVNKYKLASKRYKLQTI